MSGTGPATARSEDPALLSELLDGIEHTLLSAGKDHMLAGDMTDEVLDDARDDWESVESILEDTAFASVRGLNSVEAPAFESLSRFFAYFPSVVSSDPLSGTFTWDAAEAYEGDAYSGEVQIMGTLRLSGVLIDDAPDRSTALPSVGVPGDRANTEETVHEYRIVYVFAALVDDRSVEQFDLTSIEIIDDTEREDGGT